MQSETSVELFSQHFISCQGYDKAQFCCRFDPEVACSISVEKAFVDVIIALRDHFSFLIEAIQHEYADFRQQTVLQQLHGSGTFPLPVSHQGTVDLPAQGPRISSGFSRCLHTALFRCQHKGQAFPPGSSRCLHKIRRMAHFRCRRTGIQIAKESRGLFMLFNSVE